MNNKKIQQNRVGYKNFTVTTNIVIHRLLTTSAGSHPCTHFKGSPTLLVSGGGLSLIEQLGHHSLALKQGGIV